MSTLMKRYSAAFAIVIVFLLAPAAVILVAIATNAPSRRAERA